MQSCVDVARRFCDYAVLVHDSCNVAPGGAQQCLETADQASSSSGRASRGEVDVSGELLRLFEVIMNLLLQKTGVFLQARQAEHQNLKVHDWQQLLQFTNGSLDKVRGQHDRTRQRICAKESGSVGDDVGRGLRALLYGQTKIIIEEFHQRHLAQLTEMLEQEMWERTDVPQPYKQLLEQLVGRQALGDASPSMGDASPNAIDPAGVDRSLQVDHLNFLVVPAVLTLIQ